MGQPAIWAVFINGPRPNKRVWAGQQSIYRSQIQVAGSIGVGPSPNLVYLWANRQSIYRSQIEVAGSIGWA